MVQDNYDPHLVEQMYNSGLPVSDILEITGMHRSHLTPVLQKMGVRRGRIKRLNDQQQDKIYSLHLEGISNKEIARLVGYSEVTVAKVIRNNSPGATP